jgi:DNA-directed RNA polymerase sigma subunit (sigma70/sigma32)
MQAHPPETRPRRVYLYDQSVEDAAAAVQAAVDSVKALPAPEDRARAASAVLLVLKEANATLAKLRQADVKAMRAAGMTWGQIGAVLGVHRSRARQIETGAPMGNSSRSRAAKSEGGQQ